MSVVSIIKISQTFRNGSSLHLLNKMRGSNVEDFDAKLIHKQYLDKRNP